jgi:hypothetical protein
MGARFLEPVPRGQAAFLRRFVDEALAALDVELDVPVTVVDRHGLDGPDDPRTAAWANSQRGVFVCRDQVDLDDDELRQTMAEEVAHYWLMRAYPAIVSTLHSELFVTWFVARICRTVSVSKHLDPSDRYHLGKYAGAARRRSARRSPPAPVRCCA